MNTELIIRSNSSDIDFALLKDGKLIELHKDSNDNKFAVGDIFLAKVKKTLNGLNASFVNVGSEKDAFLHYHDLGPKFLSAQKFMKQIQS
ncbi:MAG: ribonuclease E/G, partial [Flavobacteriaceae bacterium]